MKSGKQKAHEQADRKIEGVLVGTEEIHAKTVTITVSEDGKWWRAYLGNEFLTKAKSRQGLVGMVADRLAGSVAKIRLEATLGIDDDAVPIIITGIDGRTGNVMYHHEHASGQRGQIRASTPVMKRLTAEQLDQYVLLIEALRRFELTNALVKRGDLKGFVIDMVQKTYERSREYRRRK